LDFRQAEWQPAQACVAEYPSDMDAVFLVIGLYSGLATLVLFIQGLFVLWVVFGAFLAPSRALLRRLHTASLIWGILLELLPWPYALTLVENWLEQRAGIEPYQGGFLLHLLDQLIYPNVPASALTDGCSHHLCLNLAF
jgi:Protein of Unknown function (DUF2784)